jgi:hypothetical protein
MAIPVVVSLLMAGVQAEAGAVGALVQTLAGTNALAVGAEFPQIFQVLIKPLELVAEVGHSKMGVAVRLVKLLLLTKSA